MTIIALFLITTILAIAAQVHAENYIKKQNEEYGLQLDKNKQRKYKPYLFF